MHKGKSLSPFIMVKMSRVAFKLSSPLILLSSGQPTNQKFPSPIGTSRASHSSRFSIPEFRAVGRQLGSYLETGFEEIGGEPPSVSTTFLTSRLLARNDSWPFMLQQSRILPP